MLLAGPMILLGRLRERPASMGLQGKGIETPEKSIRIHDVDKNKNGRNSEFRNGYPSILDKYNYVSNWSNRFSAGSGQNYNLPQ